MVGGVPQPGELYELIDGSSAYRTIAGYKPGYGGQQITCAECKGLILAKHDWLVHSTVGYVHFPECAQKAGILW